MNTNTNTNPHTLYTKKHVQKYYLLTITLIIGLITTTVYPNNSLAKEEQNKGRILQIAQLGNPILLKIAQPVKNLSAPNIKQLIKDLKTTVYAIHGLGLSAPQVHQFYRIFIISCHPNPRYPNAPTIPPFIVINPEIISSSKEKVKGWEGGLSIPGIRALVPRHKKIAVKYTTEEGKTVKHDYVGILAIIFQHELDHLNGRLILDRVENTGDIATEKEYQRIIQKNPKQHTP